MKEGYAVKDFFLAYREKKKLSKKGKSLKEGDYVVQADYGMVLTDYYSAISKMVIYDAFNHYNSNRMGTIRVVKYRPNLLDKNGDLRKQALKVDWQATKKSWEGIYGIKYNVQEFKKFKDKPFVYHCNDHSDGWTYRWDWDRITCYMKHQSKYYFRATRGNKRSLAAAIKSIPSLDFSQKEINSDL